VERKDVEFKNVFFIGAVKKSAYSKGKRYNIRVQATQNLIGVWQDGTQPNYHSYKNLQEFEQNWGLKYNFTLLKFEHYEPDSRNG